MFLKILSKADYKYLKDTENDYYKKCAELGEIKREINYEKAFILKVKNKLHGTRAVIYDIKEDRYGRDTYICVQDLRRPFSYGNNFMCMEGNLNIFVMNEEIYPSDISWKFNDMPYLETKFNNKHIHIYELHSRLNNISYENKGYGKMMLNTLIEIGRKSGCTSIGGRLSDADADTDEKRDTRNRFYKNRGFILSFKDEECRNGSFCLNINNEK